MPPSDTRSVPLGYVSRPNGLRGAVVIHLDPSLAGVVTKGLPVELRPRTGDAIRTKVRSASAVRDGLRVTFDASNDRNAAEALVGAEIFVERERLGPFGEGEYLESDLVGVEVATADGRVLGRLVEIIATGANDVYVVAGDDGTEMLVPAIEKAAIEVDLAARRMTVAADAIEYGR